MGGQRRIPGRFSPDDKPVPIMRDSKADALSSSRRRSLDKVFVMDFDDSPAHANGGAPHGPHYDKHFFCWRMSRRHWIAAVVGSLVVVLLTVLLVIFFAVVPSIFQSNVDKVQLAINYMDIKSMSVDAKGANKMDVELSVRVEVDASVASTMDAADATLFFEDKPFSAVTLPAQTLAKGANAFDLVLRNQAEITDEGVFRALSKALITQQSVAVDARARVKAHAMGLSYSDLKLERTFAIKAFNQFRDPKPVFNNIALSACTSSAYKMRINMTLDNVAQVGIGGIGALNMSVYYQQSYLGQAISTDVSLGLPRGPTPMVLELTIAKSPKVLPAMTGMLTGMLAMNAQFYATGNHPYATPATLLRDAFAELNMSMPYVDGLKKVTLNPKCDLLSLLSAATTTATTTTTTTAPPSSS